MSNRRTTKATKLKISSATKAKKYFKDKMACATGPVELERWVKQGEPVNIVDVRALEDYAEGHIPGVVNLPKAQWHDAKNVNARLNKKKINVLLLFPSLPIRGHGGSRVRQARLSSHGTRRRLALVPE